MDAKSVLLSYLENYIQPTAAVAMAVATTVKEIRCIKEWLI